MAITEGVDDFCSHPYLVCLWRETEGSPWRASLRHAREQRAIPFPDLETLALYLLALPEQLSVPTASRESQEYKGGYGNDGTTER